LPLPLSSKCSPALHGLDKKGNLNLLNPFITASLHLDAVFFYLCHAMKLSVIIVNYNVKFFLEQCLISVQGALEGIESEVFVVDNASADGSCPMVKQRFPRVTLIENKKNHGFSYANNQAIRQAKGEYILLLNPDTVVEEDTFSKCIAFMDNHPDAGGLSVKMIDGKGRFLPESKRALPTPMVSFYKIFGLSRLFPRSRVFARYHLGHLDSRKIHEIEILPGAFMFLRKAALDTVGLLDEAFFMYGEDIDLSYRITRGGYKNYYYPETTIIHYKGESTKKGSINYVLVFYKAMMIFARKHFSRKNASIYIALIYMAIYFRAFLSICKRFFHAMWQPVVDALFMIIGFIIIVPFWEQYKFHGISTFPDRVVVALSALYILIWILSSWLAGAYDKPRKLFSSAKGIAIGTLVILAIYALLPMGMRYSRAIILLTALWSMVLVQASHLLLGLYRKDLYPALLKKKRIAIVGGPDEVKRVLDILGQAGVDTVFLGAISPTQEVYHPEQVTSIDRIHEFARINQVDEVIFCSGDISSQEIIRNMLLLVPAGIDYKIAPPDSISIIGSNSINTSGDLYTIDISAITKPANRRNKRIFDVAVALVFIIFSPFVALFVRRGGFIVGKAVEVLFGRLTWIGYDESANTSGMPPLRRGVFTPLPKSKRTEYDTATLERANIMYAKDYSIVKDLSILWNNIRNL